MIKAIVMKNMGYKSKFLKIQD